MSKHPLDREISIARNKYEEGVRALARGYELLAESLTSGASVPSYCSPEDLAKKAAEVSAQKRVLDALLVAKGLTEIA